MSGLRDGRIGNSDRSVVVFTVSKAHRLKSVLLVSERYDGSRTHSSKEANLRNETRPDSQLAHEFGPEYGLFGAVAAHAFGATRHMHLYGTTRDQFGAIAVAFREHALRNPDAQQEQVNEHRAILLRSRPVKLTGRPWRCPSTCSG